MSSTEPTTVTFYDNYIPKLPAAEYQLTVTQKVVKKEDSKGSDKSGAGVEQKASAHKLQKDPVPPPEVSQRFIVRGPRFRLLAADIHRQFPPPQGTGIYHEHLPMVVFNKRSVPWERRLRVDEGPKNAAPWNPKGKNVAPWMALLVFTADQLTPTTTPVSGARGGEGSNTTNTVPQAAASKTMTLTALLSPPTGTRAPHFCKLSERTGDKAKWTALEDDEDPDKIDCDVIELTTDTFRHMLPTWAELPLLAHCREVSGAEKEQALAVHDGWHSVLMANRFAVPPPDTDVNTRQMLNIVHLVALEGFEDILEGDADAALKGIDKVRMISLWNWTFNCVQNPKENFAQLMRHLISPESKAGTNLLLKIPPPTRDKTLKQLKEVLGDPPPEKISGTQKKKVIEMVISLVGHTNGAKSDWAAYDLRWTSDPQHPKDFQDKGKSLVIIGNLGGKLHFRVFDADGKMVTDTTEDTIPFVLELPTGNGAAEANRRIKEGYVALEYRLRNGSKSFAWYRGPCSPVAVSSFLAVADPASIANPQVPMTATEAMIFDPKTGLFDQSYAVAFEIGRMLALSSQPFATNLLQWRREAHAVVDLLLERIRAHHPIDQTGQPVVDAKNNLASNGIEDLKALLDRRLVSSTFENYLAGEFASTIARRIGKIGGFSKGDTYDYSGPGDQPPPAHPTEHRHLSDLMADPDVVSLLHELSGLDKKADGGYAAAIMPDQIIEWLAQLKLLYDVPFNYLVPEKRMLPNETIRFFYIDPNWTEALIDGALGITLQSSRDSLFHKLTRDKLHRAVDRVVHQVRERFSGLPPTEKNDDAEPSSLMAGFLLNSTVVKSWTGLEVAAWYALDPKEPLDDQNLVAMKPLRLERVSPNILLAIFPYIPVRVVLNEPAEGLVFGTEDTGIDIRAVTGPQKGQTLYKPGQGVDKYSLLSSDIPRRSSQKNGALQLEGDKGLIKKLENLFPDNPKPVFSPASFAVQMVRVPEQMRFDFPTENHSHD